MLGDSSHLYNTNQAERHLLYLQVDRPTVISLPDDLRAEATAVRNQHMERHILEFRQGAGREGGTLPDIFVGDVSEVRRRLLSAYPQMENILLAAPSDWPADMTNAEGFDVLQAPEDTHDETMLPVDEPDYDDDEPMLPPDENDVAVAATAGQDVVAAVTDEPERETERDQDVVAAVTDETERDGERFC